MRHVTNKHSHLGRAGQFATMAEILARGWNVAIPEVDVGDDVFVARDDASRLTRVQVKTSAPTALSGRDAWETEGIKLASHQLFATTEAVPLTYVFAIPFGERWEFVVVSRTELAGLWRGVEAARSARVSLGLRPRGRPRIDPTAIPDEIAWVLRFTSTSVTTTGGLDLQSVAKPMGSVRADPQPVRRQRVWWVSASRTSTPPTCRSRSTGRLVSSGRT